jgi:hypothetical protein
MAERGKPLDGILVVALEQAVAAMKPPRDCAAPKASAARRAEAAFSRGARP